MWHHNLYKIGKMLCVGMSKSVMSRPIDMYIICGWD